MVADISVNDLQKRLQSGDKNFIVLDVREPWELAIAKLPVTVNIPMGQIPQRLDDLPKDKDILVFCHHGNRSRRVGDFLLQNGFTKVLNVAGGIAAWSADIDPSVPMY